MFKTASFCRLGPEFALPPLTALEETLQAQRFVPCGPTQPESYGWIAPRGNKSLTLAESVAGHVILNLCTEKRALPASAVKAAVDECIEKYKKETGNERVGAKIKKQFKEEVLLDLLPRAFSKRSSTMVWLDAANKLLDEAAVRIVQLSAPFAAFPADISKDTDILSITRTWTFTRADRLLTE